jgi:hypothetical protein
MFLLWTILGLNVHNRNIQVDPYGKAFYDQKLPVVGPR